MLSVVLYLLLFSLRWNFNLNPKGISDKFCYFWLFLKELLNYCFLTVKRQLDVVQKFQIQSRMSCPTSFLAIFIGNNWAFEYEKRYLCNLFGIDWKNYRQTHKMNYMLVASGIGSFFLQKNFTKKRLT